MIRWASGGILFALVFAVLSPAVEVIHAPGGPRPPAAPRPFPLGGLQPIGQPPLPFQIPPEPGASPPLAPFARAIRPAAPSPAGPGKLDRQGDPMPPGAIARFGTVRLRHGIEPIALHFAPDGKQLLSVSDTAEGIRLWDTTTGRETARLDLPIVMGAIAPDGQILVSDGARCKVWSPKLKTVRELPAGTLPENTTVLAITADSQTFAAGTPGKIVLRDLQSGQPRGELNAPPDLPPMRLVFSPDGRWLAGMGPNKSGIWLWDLKRQKRIRTYPTPSDHADFAFSATGEHMAIATESLHVYSTDSEELPAGFTAPEGPYFSPRFGSDGQSVFAARADASVVRIDASTGEVKDDWPPPEETLRAPVTLSPTGELAAATDASGGIRIWNPKTGQGPTADRLPALFDPAFAGDGTTVLVHDERGAIRTFDPATGSPGPVYDPKIGDSLAVNFDGRSGRIAVAVGIDTFEIHIIDVKTGKTLAKLPTSNVAMPGASFCPVDPNRVAIFDEGSMTIYSLNTLRPIRTIAVGQNDAVLQGGFSPDGRLLAATTRPLSVWEVATGKKRFEVEGITDPMGVAFSPDGRFLAVWDVGDVVVIFDVRSGTSVRRFQLPTADGSLSTAVFTPDSKRLVTGGRDGLITFWDVASGEPVLNLDRHDGLVTGLDFSPDGTRLVSTATDGTALVWDLTSQPERKESTAVAGPDEALKLLGDPDAAEAYRGMKYLSARPAETVKWLRDKIPVPRATPRATIEQLVDELGHEDFQTRRAAVAKLIAIGGEAAAPLQKAAANDPSAEVRKLAEEVLAKLDGPPTRSDDLRAIRAVELLEHMARDSQDRSDARDLLRTWAAGPPGHRLTVEAAAALKRLQRR